MKSWYFSAIGLAAAIAIIGPSSGKLEAQEFVDEMRPLPGQYAADMRVLSVDMPDAPPDMAKMIGSMMSRKFEFCLTPEQVKENFRAILNRGQDGCTYTRYSATGGKIDAALTCEGDEGPMTMVMSGTGTPTSSDVTMTMSGDMGMGPGSITMRVINKRLGDCS